MKVDYNKYFIGIDTIVVNTHTWKKHMHICSLIIYDCDQLECRYAIFTMVLMPWRGGRTAASECNAFRACSGFTAQRGITTADSLMHAAQITHSDKIEVSICVYVCTRNCYGVCVCAALNPLIRILSFKRNPI